MDVGSVRVFLTLDTSAYDRALETYKAKTQLFSADLQKLLSVNKGLTLKPTVDDSALTALNKHLDLKLRHFKEVQRYFDSNPLRVKTDTAELDKAISKLKDFNQASQQIKVQPQSIRTTVQSVNPASSINSADIEKSTQQLAKSFEQSLKKNLSPNILQSALGTVFNLSSGLVNSTLGSVSRGAFEGLGRNLSKSLSDGLTKGLETAISPSIGSFELVGKTLSSSLSKAIGANLSDATKKEIQDGLSDALGSKNISIERFARVQQNRVSDNSRLELAREGSTFNRRQVIRSYNDTKDELSNRESSIQGVQSQLNKGIELQKKLETLRNQELVKGSDVAKIQALTDDIGELGKEILKLVEAERHLNDEREKLAQEVERQGKAVKQSSVQNKELAPESLPEVYKKIIRDIAPNISEDAIPRIRTNDAGLAKKGAIAQYDVESNTIELRKSLSDAIKAGTLTLEQFKTLYHELQHGVDFDFGSNRGVNARRENRIVTEAVIPTKEELRSLAPLLNQYKPEQRGYELNAEVLGTRNANKAFAEQEVETLRNKVSERFGYLGVNYNSDRSSEVEQLKKRFEGFKSISKDFDVPVSDDFNSFIESLETFEQGVSTISDKLLQTSSLAASELEALANDITESLNALESLNSGIESLKGTLFKNIESTQTARREQVSELLPQFNLKRDLVPLAEKYNISSTGLNKKELIEALVGSSNIQNIQSDVLEMTRAKAQRQLERRENIINFAANTGQAARSAVTFGSNVLNSTPVQVAGQLGIGAFNAAKGIEGIALDALPFGRSAKGLLQNTVVPAALFGTATHFLPGGGMLVEGANALASGVTHPLLQAGSNAISSGATEFIGNAVPNVMGLQGSLTSAVTGAVDSISMLVADVSGSTLAAIAGGKAIETVVKMPLSLPQNREMIALPASKNNNILKAASTSSSAIVPSADPKKISDDIISNVENISETALTHAKRISGQFSKSYKQLKVALGSGDLDLASKLSAEIVSMGDTAAKEIGEITTSAGDAAQFGTELGNKLANTKSLISRYTNSSRRVLKGIENNNSDPAIDVDSEDLTAQRLEVEKVGGVTPEQKAEADEFNKLLENAIRNADRFDNAFKSEDKSSTNRFNEIHNALSKTLEDFENGIPILSSFEKNLGGLGNALSFVGKGLLAFTVLNTLLPMLISLGSSSLNTAIEMERLTNVINFASESGQGANNIDFVRERVNKLNVDLKTALASYGQLAASTKDTPLEGQATNNIFDSVSQAGAVFNLDPERQKNAFLALSQVASKGVVSMEELRGQLGEAIPGALQIASRSLGITTGELNRLVASGTLASEDFLPKFANQLKVETSGGVDAAANSSQGVRNRFNNSITGLQENIGNTILPAFNEGTKLAASGIELLTKSIPTLVNMIGALGISLTVNWIKPMIAASLQSVNLQGSLLGIGGTIKTLTPILGNFLAKFVLFTAVIETFRILSEKFSDLGGNIREFADNSSKSLEEVELAFSKLEKLNSKNVNLPTRNEEVTGGSYMENIPILNMIPKEVFRKSEQVNSDTPLARLLKSLGVDLYKSKAQKAQEDIVEATDDLINTSKSSIEKMNTQIGSNGEPIDILKQMLDIDKTIESLTSKKRSLNISDTSGRAEVQAEIDTLLKAREALSEPLIKLQSSNAAQITDLENSLKALDALAASGGITQKNYATKTAELKAQLEAANKAQERFNQLIKGNVDQLRLLGEEFKGVTAKLQDANGRIEATSSANAASISQSLGNGSISSFEAQQQNLINDQSTLYEKIKLNQQAIEDYKRMFNDPLIQDRLNTYGLQGAGAEQIRIKASSAELANSKDAKVLEQAADIQDAVNQKTVESNNQLAQIGQANASARDAIRETSKSLRDYFQGVTDAANSLYATVAGTKLDTEIQNIKNKLQRKLSGLNNRFFGGLADSISGLLDSLYAPLKNAIEASNEIRGYQEQVRNTAQQGQELLNGLSPANNDSNTSQSANNIVNIARDFVGEEFAPGIEAQCANFVRAVLEKAGLDVGVTGQALDGLETGSALASSFFGTDIGSIIRDRSQIKPGDLLAFGGTYGGYSDDTITHVGIATGNNMMVDRSTTSQPVRERSIDTFSGDSGQFLYAVRPNAYGTPNAATQNNNSNTQSSSSNNMPSINGVSSDKIAQAVAYYLSQGLSKQGAAYLVGNLIQESGLDHNAVGDGGRARGLAQWHPDRRANMPSDYEGQRAFVLSEMQNDSPDSLATLRDPNASAADLQRALKNWERYGDEGSRYQFGAQIYQNMGGITANNGSGSNSAMNAAANNYVNSGNNITQQAANAAIEATQNRLRTINEQASIEVEQKLNQIRRKLEDDTDELDQTRIANQRRLEDAQTANMTQTPEVIRDTALRSITRESDDNTRELKLNIRDAKQALQELQTYRDFLAEQGKKDARLLELIPGLDQAIAKTKSSTAEMEATLSQFSRQSELQREQVYENFAREDIGRRLAARGTEYGTDNNLATQQIQQMNRSGQGYNTFGLQNRIDTQSHNLDMANQLNNLAEQHRLGQITNEEYDRMIQLLTELNAVTLDNLTNNLEQARNAFDYDQLKATTDSRMDIVGAMSANLKGQGYDRQANELDKMLAYAQNQSSYDAQVRSIDEMEQSGKYTNETITELRENLETLNNIKLEGLKDQFSVVGQLMPGLQNSFQGLFSGLISGSQSAGEVLKSFLDSIVSQLADMASKFLSNELFGAILGTGSSTSANASGALGLSSLMPVLGGLFGGGGGSGLNFATGVSPNSGGSFASTALSIGASLFNFSEGVDKVPSMDMSELRRSNTAIGRALRKEGSNSVLAALTPGERVLTVAENRIFEANRLDRVLQNNISNFASGGVVGGAMNFKASSGGGLSIPVNVAIGDNSNVNPMEVRQSIENVITQWAQKESRPNGMLNRR